ncbi:MAG: glycerol-3-phosphate dehydrogenase C-terminal domain-containing protein, partial [Erythrobacter sp.]
LSTRQWTADEPLPGGDIKPAEFDAFVARMQDRYSFLPPATVLRLARAYGTRMIDVLSDKQGLNDMGAHLGGDLYAAELRYLVEHEFARSADDVMRRRSKLYLHLSPEEQARVEAWFKTEPALT